MKRLIAPLGSLVAVAGVAVLALFLAGVFDGNEASGNRGGGAESAGLCAEDQPDCEDTLTGTDGDGYVADDEEIGVAPGCAVGHVGVCDDTPIADGETGDIGFEGDGPQIEPMCVQGVADCGDTIVEVDDKVAPIGMFDDDYQSESNASGNDIADGGPVEEGVSATSSGAVTSDE